MRKKYILIVVSIVAALAAVAVVASAGDPDNPPGPPETTSSYRLEDIYNRLSTSAAGTQITFTEPISGPSVGTGHTLDEIMAVAPQVDDTNGATASQVASGTTYWGLQSGAWGLQTGAAPLVPVPKTGQVISYTVGDDGDLGMGVDCITATRFITGTTGVVTDTLTGLIWLENANCWGFETWAPALAAANGLAAGYCGLTDGSSPGDWRLPNVRELQSLIDYGGYGPALPGGHPFTGVHPGNYWSSSTLAGVASYALYVSLGSGIVNGGGKDSGKCVLPVRGGQ